MITDTFRVAIVTKYLGPTNTKGGRIVADAGLGRRKIVGYNHAKNTFDAHAEAAQALCDKMGWSGDLLGGATETGFAFVFKD